MSLCELCGKQHDGDYGSGRFCSCHCARGFSTSLNRDVISKKVSKKLQKSFDDDFSNEKLQQAVSNAKSWRNLMSILGYRGNANIIRHFQSRVLMLKLDVSHFWRPRTISEILSNRPGEPKGQIRKALIKSGRELLCEECSQFPYWNGKSLTLQIDHINGEKCDHRSENLRFLCPNCHSQTSTFAGRNVKRSVNLGDSSNGRTPDFESGDGGSNPPSPTKEAHHV